MNAHTRILDWPSEPRNGDTLQDGALWDAASIARAVRGTASGDFTVSGVEIDSRDVEPGDLFFALKGEATDGHRFVEMALRNGAAAAVVERPVDGPHILVRDTAEALEALAAAARERVRAQVIGVTGSVGKTSV
ncbi:MAG TPA: Mur ligase domain-containing protein, partial [Novosphingobium sp.]|nr:Mur ligase domain-containing protein [Novosphingobium sp.]